MTASLARVLCTRMNYRRGIVEVKGRDTCVVVSNKVCMSSSH